ncbi:MAG: substrate-binding domain-containing protein [Nitrospirota bacterium]
MKKTLKSVAHIVLASTTSPQNTGLLDILIQEYYKWSGLGARIDIVSVGTGAALDIARRGDADLVLVHDPEMEKAFVAEGYGIDRREVMYNDFIILGPSQDPAGIKKAGSAAKAFKMISESFAPFVSRGDESGTHDREKKFWKSARVDIKQMKDFITAGKGMVDTLKIADRLNAYILSDRGTYLARKGALKNITLLFEGDPALNNKYSIMAVNPAKHPHVRYSAARDFIEFITGPIGQKVIDGFRDGHGNALFHPIAGPNAGQHAGQKKTGARKIA